MTDKRKFGSFLMLDRELIVSPAWRSMSINCKRLLDFLCEEHLSKGGRENGKLMATYDQLVISGIPRRLVHRTITEAEQLGLIDVERGGRKGCVNHVSTFMVNFLPTFSGKHWKSPKGGWQKLSMGEVLGLQRNLKIKTRLLKSS